MFPNSSDGEKLHRKRKREMEVSLSVGFIEKLQKDTQCKKKLKDVNVLEFGCGDGFQVPYLKKIGNVIASDVYRGELRDVTDFEFVECDITNTPFESRFFDIIYSNHVIEHVENLEEAFGELIRIGDDNCIYAFSVPTNIWLLLSLPAQYLSKIKTFSDRLWRKKATPSDHESSGPITNLNVVNYKQSLLDKFLALLGPSGHGVTENYFQCYKNFRVESWRTLFSDSGFLVVEIRPLLLYGPSEWPLIPTLKSKFCLSSSVLFLMVKRASNKA